MKILKIRNFEGYWFTCAKCGRDIKHAYSIDGQGTYGSECVYTVADEILAAQGQTDRIARMSIAARGLEVANMRAKLLKDYQKKYCGQPSTLENLAAWNKITVEEAADRILRGELK